MFLTGWIRKDRRTHLCFMALLGIADPWRWSVEASKTSNYLFMILLLKAWSSRKIRTKTDFGFGGMEGWVKARSHSIWNRVGLSSGLEVAGKPAGGSSQGRGSSIRTRHPCYKVMRGEVC